MDFAARYWLEHARVAGENQEELFFWTSKIFVDKPFMTFWLKFYNPALEVGPGRLYNEDTVPPLYYASLGRLDRSVRLLLDRGADIDAGSDFGRSALQIAAHEGHMELVKILIRLGANVNARNRHFGGNDSGLHITALAAASNNGHVRTVQILVEHGSDINAGLGTMLSSNDSLCSGTALRAASANGHLEVVQFLLDHGADVNNERLGFALHAALVGAHTEVSLLLMERGADICAHDDKYKTAVHAAVLGGDLIIVKLLLDRGAYNIKWGLGGAVLAAVRADRFDLLENKLLAEACHRGYVAKVKLLLDFGAKFDRHFNCLTGTKNRRFNPLRHFYVASQGAQFEIAKLLVARDAKANSSDLYNATALKYACAIGRHEIVEYLLESGADVPKPCDYLSLPLDIACRNGALEVIEMLLAYGAKANACDSGALTAACKGGHIEVAQLLLAQGADVVGRRNRETPIQAACSEGHLELVKLLLANGADHNAAGGSSGSALSNACLSGNTALVNLLLDRGVDPNAMDSLYGSALQRLCATASYINLEIVQLLLDRGADVDTRGGKFRAALCDAALYDNVEVVRMLLQRGADPNLRDKRFGSALQAACGARYGTSPDLVQLLLDNGADLNARGGKYGNALCAAARTRSTAVVYMLLAEGAYINSWGGRRGDALRIALRISLQGERKDIVRILIGRGWILMIRIRPVWKRRCNMSRSQPRTRFQKRDYWRSNNPSWDSWRRVTTNGTSSGSVSSGGSCSIKSWISTGSCDVSNSESGSD
ncbi:hypothetical protein D6C88_02781 [Aureobasidium pullulans]|nr:hypothetical protein D6C88_02781 [Aureobasidium pullulans]